MRSIFCLLLCALLLGTSSASLADPPLVKVGFYEFPPYSFSDEQGRPQGAILKLTARLLLHAGYRAEFRALPSARVYAGLLDGSVHIWPGAPGKPELAGHTWEGRTPLGEIQLNLYYRPETPRPKIPEDLAGRGIILISGYSYWKPATDFLDNPQLRLQLHRTSTHAAALEMLQRHRGDFLLDYQAPVDRAREHLGMGELPYINLRSLPLHLVVSRHIAGGEALRDALDRAYAELKAAGEDLRLY
jgi:polar amino acid transport system substrate-binding protein